MVVATSGEGNYLAMQGEGNLVVYNGGKVAQWSTGTWGFPGAYLQLQDDGNLVLYQDGHAIWTYGSSYKGQILNPGEALQPGAFLLSPDHQFELIMQGDGNLVLYNAAKEALWSSQTSGEGNYAAMQTDGNFVVYGGATALWDSTTSGFSGAYLQLQDDSNLVIYQSGTAIWDWMPGRLGESEPTAAETAAVNWAVTHNGSTSYYNRCLRFVREAYEEGAGLPIQARTNYGKFNESTFPEQVWDDGFNSGTTGGSNTTPPYGALVFFNDPSDYEDSHVTIMGSGGQMISTPDAFDETAVHYETLEQAAHSPAYAKYVGWWLPDG